MLSWVRPGKGCKLYGLAPSSRVSCGRIGAGDANCPDWRRMTFGVEDSLPVFCGVISIVYDFRKREGSRSRRPGADAAVRRVSPPRRTEWPA